MAHGRKPDKTGLGRFQYLQALVKEFQDTHSKGEISNYY